MFKVFWTCSLRGWILPPCSCGILPPFFKRDHPAPFRVADLYCYLQAATHSYSRRLYSSIVDCFSTKHGLDCFPYIGLFFSCCSCFLMDFLVFCILVIPCSHFFLGTMTSWVLLGNRSLPVHFLFVGSLIQNCHK